MTAKGSALTPETDLEIELGQLIEKYRLSEGLDPVLDALDFYVAQLELQRDASLQTPSPNF